jgi:hypothetical protein
MEKGPVDNIDENLPSSHVIYQKREGTKNKNFV